MGDSAELYTSRLYLEGRRQYRLEVICFNQRGLTRAIEGKYLKFPALPASAIRRGWAACIYIRNHRPDPCQSTFTLHF